MSRAEFEHHLAEAIRVIPEPFRSKLSSLAFVIEDSRDRAERLVGRPDAAEKDELESCRLLGLYEGLPRSEYAGDRTGLLPDKITLFQDVIEAVAAQTGQDAAVIIRHTVWHEVAHYFGFNEEDAGRLETKWEARFRES